MEYSNHDITAAIAGGFGGAIGAGLAAAYVFSPLFVGVAAAAGSIAGYGGQVFTR